MASNPIRPAVGYDALTDREKQTLRMILRGHDAKSVARALGLSVHTINERLRDARRKLSVSSSREAARVLAAQEDWLDPQIAGDMDLGGVLRANDSAGHRTAAGSPVGGPQSGASRGPLFGGFVLMSILFAAALFAAPHFLAQTAAEGDGPAPAAVTQSDREAETAARAWLSDLDSGDVEGAYAAAGASFRQLNSLAQWHAAYDGAHGPLGPAQSRTLVARDDVAAPPMGYKRVRFASVFAGDKRIVETVTLASEDGTWRVVGIVLD